MWLQSCFVVCTNWVTRARTRRACMRIRGTLSVDCAVFNKGRPHAACAGHSRCASGWAKYTRLGNTTGRSARSGFSSYRLTPPLVRRAARRRSPAGRTCTLVSACERLYDRTIAASASSIMLIRL